MTDEQIAATATIYRMQVTPIIRDEIDRRASNIFESGFKIGAKWMQETSFSKEDIIDIIFEYEMYRLECEAKNLKTTTIRKWFEEIRVQ